MGILRFVAANALTRRIVKSKRSVAQRALQRRMLANQRKGGERVIKAHAYRPAGLVMAAPTAVTQLLLVGVVCGMATHAVSGQRVRQSAGVASAALQGCMCAGQDKVRHTRMIENGGLPIAGDVTALASRSVVTLVNVVFRVTRVAGAASQASRGGSVAGCAGETRVARAERKSGSSAMIKEAGLPVCVVVAILALRAKTPLVHVVFLVAGRALCGCIAKQMFDVAVGAHQRFMRAGKWKAGRAVIEASRFPTALVVTIVASRAQLAFVGIICAVTADAGAGRVVKLGAGLMTAFARNHAVGP